MTDSAEPQALGGLSAHDRYPYTRSRLLCLGLPPQNLGGILISLWLEHALIWWACLPMKEHSVPPVLCRPSIICTYFAHCTHSALKSSIPSWIIHVRGFFFCFGSYFLSFWRKMYLLLSPHCVITSPKIHKRSLKQTLWTFFKMIQTCAFILCHVLFFFLLDDY